MWRASTSTCSRRHRERREGAAHGLDRRPIGVQPLDVADLDDTDTNRDRARLDLRLQRLAARRGQLLRVVDAAHLALVRQDDGGGDQGTGERSDADLVDAGDVRQALRPQRALVPQQHSSSRRLPMSQPHVPVSAVDMAGRQRGVKPARRARARP